MPATTPATSRAMGPIVSNEGARGQTPATGTRPQVVLSPTVPQQADGVRIEPAVSVPMAMSTSWAASATALPLELPPGMQAGSNGFTGVPKAAFTPVPPQASSCRFVLPTMAASAARIAARQAASLVAGCAAAAIAAQAAVVGVPTTSIRSLMATVGPVPGASMRRIQVLIGQEAIRPLTRGSVMHPPGLSHPLRILGPWSSS